MISYGLTSRITVLGDLRLRPLQGARTDGNHFGAGDAAEGVNNVHPYNPPGSDDAEVDCSRHVLAFLNATCVAVP